MRQDSAKMLSRSRDLSFAAPSFNDRFCAALQPGLVKCVCHATPIRAGVLMREIDHCRVMLCEFLRKRMQ